MQKYKNKEFCKSIKCAALDKEQCKAKRCLKTAKEFHHWLNDNNYCISKCVKHTTDNSTRDKDLYPGDDI